MTTSRQPQLVRHVCVLLTAMALLACRSGTQNDSKTESMNASSPSNATDANASGGDGWQSLFDGTTLNGWHNYKTPGATVAGWSAIDGALVRTAAGGDLTTDREFANFELSLDWKVEAKGNSGVIYRIDPKSETSYTSGPEMQVLDDAGHPDGKSRLTAAGADYALYPSPEGIVKPAGEWNSARLVVNGNHVEHWLNDVNVVTYELGSPEWLDRKAKSKFAKLAEYGAAKRGYIALQDHGDRVSYRNIRIRELH